MMWLQSRLFILFSVIQLHSGFGKMNYIWNVMISWLLLQFLVPAQSYPKEVTVPISSSSIQLACDNDLRVDNIDVAIRRRNTTCSTTTADCTLPNDAIVIIKKECNKQVSCEVDIRSFTNNQSCLDEYGYFNFWYKCKTIIDYSCDFESDLCNWSSVKKHDRFQWKHGLRDKPKPPTIDHTSASTEGKYAYILADQSEINDFAKLESGYIIGTEQQCFSFWYFTTNYRDSVNVYHNGKNLYDLSSCEKRKWHHIHISLKKSNTVYKLVFEVIRGDRSNYLYGAIVIDDILIENRNCNSPPFECDFDTDSYSCQWNIQNSDQNEWVNQNGYSWSYTGPKYDHSKTSKSGSYMYLNSESGDDETTEYLEFPNVDMNILVNSCFTFWYYMHGYGIGGLNVTLDEEFVWTNYADQDDKWQKGRIDLHKGKLIVIKFIGIIGNDWIGDIAIDDLTITEGSCNGLFDHEELCVHLVEGIPKETFCPRGYLDFTNQRLAFDPEKEECSDTYNETKMRMLQECRHRNDSQKCLIDLSTDIRSHLECFQVYEFRIIHTCEDEETTTVSSNTTSRGDSSADLKTTTVPSFTTSNVISSTVSDESITLSRLMRNSSDSATGLVVGLVIGALLMVCVVIVIVILIRRHTFKSNPREKIRNNLGGNDYIGSQDIALPLTANHSSHMQKNGMYDGSSNTSVNGYDSRHANAQINNTQHEYTNLGAINGFVNKEKVQVPTYAHRRDKTFSDNHMSNDEEYANVDPTAETSFNESINNRTGNADSYMVLDPTKTGFNRQLFSNTPTGNEFAKPVRDMENKIGDEDQYDISDEGVYDHSGSSRHKELEDNIYNHAVDTIYDSGSHKKNNEGREDTYDHFFGQKTEDGYDVSTRT